MMAIIGIENGEADIMKKYAWNWQHNPDPKPKPPPTPPPLSDETVKNDESSA